MKNTQTFVSFWDFSYKIHGVAGVDAALMTLQDKSGYDVTMTLGGLFAALTGAPPLTEEKIAGLLGTFAAWRTDILGEIRKMRRDLKSGSYGIEPSKVLAIRERIKTLELDTEQLMVEALEPHLRGKTPRAPADAAPVAQGNIKAYAKAAGLPLGVAENAQIDVLMTALAQLTPSS